jgi:hypothetical protein
MAIGIVIEIPGGTKAQYDAVMQKLQLNGRLPTGGLYHVAGPMEGGWRVVDVWESEEAFQRFFQTKLGHAIKEAGVPPFHPKVFPVHNSLKAA